VAGLGIEPVVSAPRAPWQNPYVERFIGSVRRECFDHVVVRGEDHARRVLRRYLEYYERSRTHLSLAKDAPVARPMQQAEGGAVVAIPQVGGLHHRYERLAA
jgi:transposase InsO family protein